MGMPTFVTSDMSRSDAITDIIQSVALQQAALSHILNAEGEKIQHVLGSKCSTTDEILAVNKSVRSMVDSVSKLEILLQHKLSLFEDVLCHPCPQEHTPHPKEHAPSPKDDHCKTLSCRYDEEFEEVPKIDHAIQKELEELRELRALRDAHQHHECQCDVCRSKR